MAQELDLDLRLRHIYYELWMFFQTGLRIKASMDSGIDMKDEEGSETISYSAINHTSPPPKVSVAKAPTQADLVASNAQIESFAIHTRVLLQFFFSEKFKNKDTDILAEHFFESGEIWRQTRERVWDPDLEKIRNRVGREIAHITSFRKAIPMEEKKWPVSAILQDIALISRRFLDSLPPSVKPEGWTLEKEIDEILGSA